MQSLQHHYQPGRDQRAFRVVNRYVGNLAAMPGVFAYRTDHRNTFKMGEVMETPGGHLDVAGFPEISRRAELALRDNPRHTDIRAGALYLYPDPQMALEDWRHRGRGIRALYEVSFEDEDLLHTGDLETFDLVAKAIGAAKVPSAEVEKYWAGCSPSRYSEYLVRKSTVVDIVREAAGWKPLYQTAVEKLRDEPDNADWYRDPALDRKD